ncbi:MAG: dihydropteroate synthase [Desulfobacterales bacterium S5133MH4]|nr:MAG: dihydropteroate synthase [Desulfobacterales bacterium S5133MH4]
MILIGENLNIMVKSIGQAMKERNPKPIQELAVAEAEAGVDYIDVNLGPARKGGEELMEWMVKTIQEVVDLPLYLDTTNVNAIEAGLKAYKNKQGKAVINSIMCRPERMEAQIPLVTKYDAGMVALLWGPEGMPRDAAERGLLAADILQRAAEAGVAGEDIWVDPIITPVNVQQNQLLEVNQFMSELEMIAEVLVPGCRSTCGLSNVSNGPPDHLRSILNQTYMVMLEKFGMRSCIVDAFDKDLHEIAKGKRPETVALVHRLLDGDDPDMQDLSKEAQDYVKTVKVLLGHSLYSDSWLEL